MMRHRSSRCAVHDTPPSPNQWKPGSLGGRLEEAPPSPVRLCCATCPAAKDPPLSLVEICAWRFDRRFTQSTFNVRSAIKARQALGGSDALCTCIPTHSEQQPCLPLHVHRNPLTALTCPWLCPAAISGTSPPRNDEKTHAEEGGQRPPHHPTSTSSTLSHPRADHQARSSNAADLTRHSRRSSSGRNSTSHNSPPSNNNRNSTMPSTQIPMPSTNLVRAVTSRTLLLGGNENARTHREHIAGMPARASGLANPNGLACPQHGLPFPVSMSKPQPRPTLDSPQGSPHTTPPTT